MEYVKRGFERLYDVMPGAKPSLEETWRLTGGDPRVLERLWRAKWNTDDVVTRIIGEREVDTAFVARRREWLAEAVNDPDALCRPRRPDELVDELVKKNLIIYGLYPRRQSHAPPQKVFS